LSQLCGELGKPQINEFRAYVYILIDMLNCVLVSYLGFRWYKENIIEEIRNQFLRNQDSSGRSCLSILKDLEIWINWIDFDVLNILKDLEIWINWIDFDVLNNILKCLRLCMNAEMWNYKKLILLYVRNRKIWNSIRLCNVNILMMLLCFNLINMMMGLCYLCLHFMWKECLIIRKYLSTVKRWKCEKLRKWVNFSAFDNDAILKSIGVMILVS
jgi:hypothetical protein